VHTYIIPKSNKPIISSGENRGGWSLRLRPQDRKTGDRLSRNGKTIGTPYLALFWRVASTLMYNNESNESSEICMGMAQEGYKNGPMGGPMNGPMNGPMSGE
jgi:hypothetical protein